MESSHRDALWFLAPGALHDLGNAMFTVQGHAHLLPDGAARAALLAAVARVSTTLSCMRCLLGDDAPVETTVLLRQLLLFARIAMRDAGLRLELAQAPNLPAAVSGAILPSAALALRAFAAAPAGLGVPGTVRIAVEPAGDARIAVSMSWLPDRGQLQFPLDAAGILQTVRNTLPAGLEATMEADRLTLWLPAAGAGSSLSVS